ncbi:hypothetical protein [Fervidobacterium islandicum]|uniref:hypothetical protein n=1 Tax=Fervidobacterium islandicum TaxID=2423 RepID=UPI003A782890
MKNVFSLILLVFFLPNLVLLAHAPIVSSLSGSNMAEAIPIKNIDISQVLYKVFKEDNSFLWMTFEGKGGDELYFQIGTPKEDKYIQLRPAVVIIGPGFPKVDGLPFEIPAEMGAVVCKSMESPTAFYEPVTDTNSWIHLTKRITLPQTGRYYLVAFFPPDGKAGNLFVAVGTKERFTMEDIINVFKILPEIRAFYGLSGLPTWMNVVLGISIFGLVILLTSIFR